jgi:hypothetical protein
MVWSIFFLDNGNKNILLKIKLLCSNGRILCLMRRRREIIMKGISKTLIAILATLMVVQPVLSWGGGSAHVIPEGNVSLLADGKEVNNFRSEMPLSEGTMMLCNGKCLVQTQNIQLVAQDQAVFALTESAGRWDLTVKSGQVDFGMRNGAKPMAFHTPHDTIQAERAILPASSAAMVRGSIMVTEKETAMTVQEGALQVMSQDGTQLVQPGQTLRLAQAQMTPAQAQTKKQQDEENDRRKAGALWWGGSTAWTVGALLVGFAAIITPAVVIGSGGAAGGGPIPLSAF